MIRWAVIGIFLAGAIGAFAWWRGSVLEDLPPPAALPAQVPTVAPRPVAANRDAILKSEEDWLRQKAAEAGVAFTTSTPEAPLAATSSTPEAVSSTTPLATSTPEATSPASSAPEEKAATRTPTSTEVATSTAATATSTPAAATSTPSAPAAATRTPTTASASSSSSSAATSTMQAKSNPRQFQIDGAGFCEYNAGVSSVLLSGYPLVMDVAVSGSWITTWTATRVVFVAPDSVPAGTYRVAVRGVNASGYCTASASSPPTVTVP